jgi:hypothetical protein
MKFVLILIMCSGISGQCIEPYQWPGEFDSMYNCLQTGYMEASKKIEEMGPETVDKIYAHIKFYCQPIQET